MNTPDALPTKNSPNPFEDESRTQRFTDSTDLVSILNEANTTTPHALVEELVQHFQRNPLDTMIPVVEDGVPVGVVVRDRLYQRLASKFGYSLYGNKQISKVMETNPLVVDVNTPLEVLSRLAMARDPEHVYDEVVVTNQGLLCGTITVQAILNAVTTRQIELARDSNPLTGLPGNRTIEREIKGRLAGHEAFAIIYTDLDYFKWFNDHFGFQTGDAIIAFMAGVLKQAVDMVAPQQAFIGHIGGDDFIVTAPTSVVHRLCVLIIERFEAGVGAFYRPSSPSEEPLTITDRWGQPVDAKGLSISLSALCCERWGQATTIDSIAQRAGELKKQAKSTPGSIFIIGKLE